MTEEESAQEIMDFRLDDDDFTDDVKLVNAVKYLKKSQNATDFNDRIGSEYMMEALNTIQAMLVKNEKHTLYFLLKSKCEKLFASLLLEYFNGRFKIDFKKRPSLYVSEYPDIISSQMIFSIVNLLKIIGYLSINSETFSTNFCIQNGLRAHLAFLRDETLLTKILDSNSMIEFDLIGMVVQNIGILRYHISIVTISLYS